MPQKIASVYSRNQEEHVAYLCQLHNQGTFDNENVRESARVFFVAASILLFAATTACHKSHPLEVHDGFELPALSPACETSRLAPGAVQIQSGIVRSGHGAVRITLHSHDNFEPGSGGDLDNERDELLEETRFNAKENIPIRLLLEHVSLRRLPHCPCPAGCRPVGTGLRESHSLLQRQPCSRYLLHRGRDSHHAEPRRQPNCTVRGRSATCAATAHLVQRVPDSPYERDARA
jgi:hypothetical protein